MKRLFTIIAAALLTASVFAQSPQKMSYQAVIRNSGGALVTNQAVGVKISILQGSPSGTLIYQEIYNPNPQTNENGLLALEIGGGIPLTGTFSTIDWASGAYFFKTETDPTGGTSYTITGTSQLLSVPYALQAKTSENYTGAITENQISDLQNYIISETDGSVTNEIQDLLLADNILKITNNVSASEIDLSNLSIEKDWCFLMLGSTQNTNISSGYPIQFSVAYGNLPLSDYKVTLYAGKTYELSANFLCGFATTAGRIDYCWYNITGDAAIGTRALLHNNYSTYNYNTQPNAHGIIKPLTDIEVELRIGSVSNISWMDAYNSFGVIKEL